MSSLELQLLWGVLSPVTGSNPTNLYCTVAQIAKGVHASLDRTCRAAGLQGCFWQEKCSSGDKFVVIMLRHHVEFSIRIM